MYGKARGIDKLKFIDRVRLSNMKEFALWVVESDRVITFYYFLSHKMAGQRSVINMQ
jgi:hypothetical protein